MDTVGIERESLDPSDGVETQRGVEVGEQSPATGDFPFQRRAECFRVDRNEQKVGLAGEVLRGRFGDLRARGEMDEAVGAIDGRALEQASGFGLAPQRGGCDLVDERCHEGADPG